jgi:3-deoxy-D-arabino-heptulosonate 7-phosphate (DAHP) synthase class II
MAGQHIGTVVSNAQGVRTRMLVRQHAHCVPRENTPQKMDLNQIQVSRIEA